ncbi:acetate-CoA ligase [Xylaria flabelliformis]|nr:acetate-CoA ligase [Xylaria flabelliformis]
MDSKSPTPSHVQDEVLQQSLQKPEEFWARQAEHLHWHKKPEATLRTGQKTLGDGVVHPTWEWFPGGEISTCYNCVDRHVVAGNGDEVAIYYDSPVTATKEKYTYSRLLVEVETLAGALRKEGVEKGDVVMLYTTRSKQFNSLVPNIPAALIGMLAVNRLGAVHSVVFGGFAPAALAQRIDACKPVLLLTASCGIVGNRPPIAYQPLVEEAMDLAAHKLKCVVIWQREQLRWDIRRSSWLSRRRQLVFGDKTIRTRQLPWQEMVAGAKSRGIKANCVPAKSEDPIYIMHTSGTTGTPKGVLRNTGGHAVGLHLTISYILNIHGPGDVSFTASDIGWVVGHSYILYAPLLTGASTVLYEGKPVGTPDASAFWRVIEEYHVKTMLCAPTALRAIKNDDPSNDCFSEIGERGGLRSLKALFLAGERSEPSLISMYQGLLDKYGAPCPHVIDNWWSTEVGSPITARALTPHSGHDRKTSVRNHAPPRIKPGSAGKPMPGFDIHVVDEQGKDVGPGLMGNIVLGLPLAPTGFRTLWENEQGFYKSYLERFKGKFLDTGDAGWVDEEGYVYVMSRNDDVLNVSAYRLSSGAIEQAISSHPLVVECCVVGVPDALKGQLPLAFIALSVADHPESVVPNAEIAGEIQLLVRRQVGAFASLGGIVQGRGMIPKTRSGKTLRRVLRELVENGVRGEFSRDVAVPSTVEDAAVVEIARAKVKEYFEMSGGKHRALEAQE